MPCPACGHADAPVFFRMPRVPVLCNVLLHSRAEALAARCADIALAFCKPASGGCGLVFNAAFKQELMHYTGQYENALHFSPHFQKYAADLAASLVERHDLHNKRLVEIGCGDGQFLAMLCRLGPNRGLGFDPAHDPARPPPGEQADPGKGSLQIIREYYGPQRAHHPADFVSCRHVLEHIPNPVAFLASVHTTIGDRPGTVVYFEVPNALWTLEQLGIWDIIYEHVLYFTPPSLRRAFVLAGFQPLRTEAVYGGQFLTIEVRPARAAAPPATPDDESLRIERLVEQFGDRYREKLSRWRGVLDDLKKTSRTAVLWGAGSKGVTFLNAVAGPDGRVGSVVDINPRKQGCFVAGTGQEIISPESLKDRRPDAVVIMNPAYEAEVGGTLRSLGVKAEIMVA